MKLSIRELNELIYCIGIARMHGQLLGTSVADNLEVALRDELDKRLEMDLSVTSHYVSNEEADEDFLSTLEQDEQRYEDKILEALKKFNNTPMTFVSNEQLKQAAQRYSDEVRVKHIHIEEDAFTKVLQSKEESKKERGWITQAILDYVDDKGACSYTEMHEFYKFITNGSNSFSHILESLRTPYKNRETRRYLAKEGKRYSDAKWVVKIANPSNWVVLD